VVGFAAWGALTNPITACQDRRALLQMLQDFGYFMNRSAFGFVSQ
jgi:hypothetical protein